MATATRKPAKNKTAKRDSTSRRPRTTIRNGRRYVEIPLEEYERLKAADVPAPPLPPPNASGNYPALETMRAMLARDILQDRCRLGLTQLQLAELAGVRVETICRIETGKHTPSVSTVEKIDAALKRVEASQR